MPQTRVKEAEDLQKKQDKYKLETQDLLKKANFQKPQQRSTLNHQY